MMQCDVVCRFCQRRLNGPTNHITNGGNGSEEYYEFKCLRCRSTQYFRSSGQPLHYLFYVGPYDLFFRPRENEFWLSKNNLPIFKLNYLPNLTPQNCNEERIKRLILFS